MANSSTKHILIVEDSLDLQALLGELFEQEDYKISRAMNGREALDYLASVRDLPSLILLDLMMPVMDGIEFREIQRKDPRLAKIPVVVMTADSNSQNKAAELGVSEIIRKPIRDIAGLVERVERLRS